MWVSEQWHGFSGTCFNVHLFGRSFACTARHVLGVDKVNYLDFRVANNLSDPYPRLLVPKRVYWYNSGAYDHLSDIAVADFDEGPDDAFDLVHNVVAKSPVQGDVLRIFGFPKATSSIEHGIDRRIPAARKLMKRQWRSLDFAQWRPFEFDAACDGTGPTSANLRSLFFEPMTNSLDGMSGSPVFGITARGEVTLAGMFVRGDARAGKGHFIDGETIAAIVFRVGVKSGSVCDELSRWLATADPEAQFARMAKWFASVAEKVRHVEDGAPLPLSEVPNFLRLVYSRGLAGRANAADTFGMSDEQLDFFEEALKTEATPGIELDSTKSLELARRERNRKKRMRRAIRGR